MNTNVDQTKMTPRQFRTIVGIATAILPIFSLAALPANISTPATLLNRTNLTINQFVTFSSPNLNVFFTRYTFNNDHGTANYFFEM